MPVGDGLAVLIVLIVLAVLVVRVVLVVLFANADGLEFSISGNAKAAVPNRNPRPRGIYDLPRYTSRLAVKRWDGRTRCVGTITHGTTGIHNWISRLDRAQSARCDDESCHDRRHDKEDARRHVCP